MALWTGHTIQVQPDGMGSPVNVGAITNFNFPLGVAISQEETAGSPYAGQTLIQSIDPRINATTRDLKKIIDLCGINGLTIKGSSNPGVRIYQAQLENGIIKSGSVHRTMTCKEGRLLLNRISASVKDDASADFQGIVLYDGTNLPVIVATAQALPAAPSDPARFTVGGALIGNLAIDCLQSLDINFGVNITTDTCGSGVYSELLSVETIKPTITMRVLNADLLKATGGVPLTGLAATHLNTVVWLKKRSADGIFVDNTTAEHIGFTAAGILTVDDAFSFTQNKRGETTLTLTCNFDGTNTPITADTTYAPEEE